MATRMIDMLVRVGVGALALIAIAAIALLGFGFWWLLLSQTIFSWLATGAAIVFICWILGVVILGE